MPSHPAAKAGSWYPASPRELERELKRCLVLGEAYLANRAKPAGAGKRPVAAVVPHAGLVYSGGVAGAAYSLIRNSLSQVDTFLVFGACHRQRLSKPAIWRSGGWETPLGLIATDQTLAEVLFSAGWGGEEPRAHLDDNAIELQTPFIKYLFPEAKILAVAMDSFPDAWDYGVKAARLLWADAGRRPEGLVVLASTDLTHYGASFGVTPAGSGPAALEWARGNDWRWLDTLLELRSEEIVATAQRDGSACGAGAAAAAAGWAAEAGCRRGQVLAYASSHDSEKPGGLAEHFVDYASVIYECEG